jgi:hypothetical protein
MDNNSKLINTNQPILWKGASFSQWTENGFAALLLSWPLGSAFHAAAYNAIHSFANSRGYSVRYNDGMEMVDYQWESNGNFTDRLDGEHCLIHLVLPQEEDRLLLFQAIDTIRSEVVFSVDRLHLLRFEEACKRLRVEPTLQAVERNYILTATVSPEQCRDLTQHCLASSDGWIESDTNPLAEEDWCSLLEAATEMRSLIKAKKLARPCRLAAS